MTRLTHRSDDSGTTIKPDFRAIVECRAEPACAKL
jgi:hypothetical protein